MRKGRLAAALRASVPTYLLWQTVTVFIAFSASVCDVKTLTSPTTVVVVVVRLLRHDGAFLGRGIRHHVKAVGESRSRRGTCQHSCAKQIFDSHRCSPLKPHITMQDKAWVPGENKFATSRRCARTATPACMTAPGGWRSTVPQRTRPDLVRAGVIEGRWFARSDLK